MNLQQKILLTLLPISILGLAVLGLWSYDYSRNALYDREVRFSDFVLDQVMRDVLEQKYQLMDRAGVVDIPIFRRRYTEEIQQELIDLTADTGRDILIFDPDSRSLLMSTFQSEDSSRDLEWRRHLLSLMQGMTDERFTSTIAINQSTELFNVAFQPDWNWYAIVIYRDDAVQDELNQVRNATILATLLVLIVSVLAFQTITSRLILIPVQRLRDAANKIASSRMATKIDVRSNDELGKLARHMEDMSEEIEVAIVQANAAADTKAAFLANMSHEIRTPMNGLLGMLELLQKTNLSQQQRSYLAVMQQSGAVLMSVINDILDISKLEVGRIDLDYQEIDLINHLRRMLELQHKPAADRHNSLMFVSSCPQPELWVRTDPVRIQQCVQNLLSNAIKFTEGGSIVMRLEVKPGAHEQLDVEISIMDTGIGIPENKMSQLFERFEQMDVSTTRKYGGTGLGLSIVKQLVELMGGSVTAESEVGQGSTFTLKMTLSQVEAPQQEVVEIERRAHPPLAPLTASSNGADAQVSPDTPFESQAPVGGVPLKGQDQYAPHILVVEPNRINQVLLQGLAAETNANLVTCKTGEDALDTLLHHGADAVMIAEELEDMPGIDLMARIRDAKEGFDPTLPIIALLSAPEEEGATNLKATSPLGLANLNLVVPLAVEDFITALDHVRAYKQSLQISA